VQFLYSEAGGCRTTGVRYENNVRDSDSRERSKHWLRLTASFGLCSASERSQYSPVPTKQPCPAKYTTSCCSVPRLTSPSTASKMSPAFTCFVPSVNCLTSNPSDLSQSPTSAAPDAAAFNAGNLLGRSTPMTTAARVVVFSLSANAAAYHC
jgi:hypothetical protein